MKQPVPHVSRRSEAEADLVPRLAFELRDDARHHRPRSAGGDNLYFRGLDVGHQSKSQTKDSARAFHARCPVGRVADKNGEMTNLRLCHEILPIGADVEVFGSIRGLSILPEASRHA